MYVYVYVRIEQPRKLEKKHDTHGCIYVYVYIYIFQNTSLKIKPGVPTKHLAGINNSGNVETKEITPS